MSDSLTEDQPTFQLTVSLEEERLRADRFLAQHADLSRTRIKTLIEQGFCLRNGQLIRDPSTTVKAGDVFEYKMPIVKDYALEAQPIQLDILHEDEDLIVINKQAGLVVHPAPGNEDGTLVNALLAHCKESLLGIGGEKRPGIIHRLDKDTSGVMVIAKTEQALTALSADFAARRIERLYHALCWGLIVPAQGMIEGAIGRDPYDRKRMTIVNRGGKPARTHYKTLGILSNAISFIQCKLETGRTHQIRVHLSKNGHPLLGDPIYLKRIPAIAKSLSIEKKNMALDFPRQALHATLLGFTHPRTKEKMRFEVPFPEDIQRLKWLLET